ncbi:MAG: sigma-70 family RNA polymerase sigma factor [Acidobacteriota bacterium]|nr:sigma-70 family RNA polymerase sigma factor [Acidobacteriota bacterium]
MSSSTQALDLAVLDTSSGLSSAERRMQEAGTDGLLMERTAAGDRGAFAELVDRYKDPLVGYLTRLSGSRDRAEDLAQETFLRLYQAADSYRHQGQLKSYLYRIATNLLRSQQRRERRWRWLQPVLRPTLEVTADDSQTRPQAGVLAEEAQHEVARALARLPLNFRAPLVLFELEGWSYQRIAELLGCQEGTVKSRIHRGRRKLKQELTPYWRESRGVQSRGVGVEDEDPKNTASRKKGGAP